MRALAVLAVVVFHLSKTALPGGFLGVDVFFVLSGYLITAIIWREIQQGDFTLMRFYDRRIRRILPALMALLVLVSVLALLLLLPSDLLGYARSLLATLVFAPNMYFFRDTGYFSAEAEQKPLLHLWSLGVEEQFYILFPLLLVAVARYAPRHAWWVVLVLSGASLACQVFFLMLGTSSPAFFLLPSRAWELGLGAAVALWPASHLPRGRWAALCAWLGAALLVLGTVLALQLPPRFPVGLPVVLGTAALIAAGFHGRPLINRLLGWRPLVAIGLVSFSLYLWHWPVIVLAKYVLVRELMAAEMAGALLLMAVLAVLSWRYVERPCRAKTLPMPPLRMAMAGLSLGLAVLAGLMWAKDGLPERLNPRAAVINSAVASHYRCSVADFMVFGQSRACVMHLPSRRPEDADLILLGNSHAQMYAPLWKDIVQSRGEHGLLIPVNGCLPLLQVNISQDCLRVAQGNLQEITKLHRAHTVVLAMTWWQDGLVTADGTTVSNPENRVLQAGLDDLIDRLHGMGKRVILIGPVAHPGWNLASIVSRQLAFGHPVQQPLYLDAAVFEQRFTRILQHFAQRPGVQLVRPDQIQCRAGRCDYLLDGRSLFADDNHIAAAELPRFRTIFEAVLPPVQAKR